VIVSPGVNAWDADVVGVHMLFSRLVEARGSAAPATGLARTVHRRLYHALVAALERRLYAGPATVYAVSERDAWEIESRFGRPTGSTPVIPHGVDAEEFSPERIAALQTGSRAGTGLGEGRVALLIGNEPTMKGFDVAIAALDHLPNDVALVLAGRFDGAQVRVWVDWAGVRDRVELLDRVVDPVRLLALADVVIAPSRQDSFNLPVLEALASGLPVVVSESAGVTEQLRECADASVVATPIDARVLADAILAALDRGADGSGRERALRMSWGESAREASTLVRREASTPRVLVLATGAGRVGGIERVTRTLVRALGDAFGEERVGVLSIWRGDQAVAGRVLRRGDPMTEEGRVGHPRSARFALDAFRLARRWRRRLAIVAVHPHLAPVAWLARVVSGSPYAVWCHGIEVWGPLERATRFGIARADRVFAPSRFTAEQAERWAGLAKGSVVVLPHAVPPGLDPGSPDEGNREPGSVLTVARLDPAHAYKGVDTLLEAWPTVLETVPEARLTVVGGGRGRARLQRRAAELGVAEAITFMGWLSDEALADEYASASLFALPGRHRTGAEAQGEGFGLVFVEAGAAGLPVLAGAGGGADDAVEDDVSGLLVDPHDVGGVAAAIVRVLTDPELARRLGKGGRRLAETRFSYEGFRDAVVELIESLPIRGLVR
jgi:glycosyltransferase involved in cell wall biosynthesis